MFCDLWFVVWAVLCAVCVPDAMETSAYAHGAALYEFFICREMMSASRARQSKRATPDSGACSGIRLRCPIRVAR